MALGQFKVEVEVEGLGCRIRLFPVTKALQGYRSGMFNLAKMAESWSLLDVRRSGAFGSPYKRLLQAKKRLQLLDLNWLPKEHKS